MITTASSAPVSTLSVSSPAAATATATDTSTAGAPDYYQALIAAVAQTFPGLASSFSPIELQSSFNYNFVDAALSSSFNAATYQFISALIQPGTNPGTVQFATGDTFPDAWATLAAGLQWALTATDQASVNNAQTNANNQANALVSSYNEAFGAPTATQMTAAATAMGMDGVTPLEYVVNYQMGFEWSGYVAGLIKVPLSLHDMTQNTRNLAAVLPEAPAGSSSVLLSAVNYFNAIAPTSSLLSVQSQGAWTIGQLQSNTDSPSTTNGGMATINGDGTAGPTVVGYQISPSVQNIVNGMGTPTNAISLSMTVVQEADSSYSASINGRAKFTCGSDFLVLSSGGASTSYNMATLSGAGSSFTVTITFPGVTQVNTTPAVWSQGGDPTTGWFYASPIQQAWSNWTALPTWLATTPPSPSFTGYDFIVKPQYNLDALGAGGDFGMLTSLLISQYPTVTITYDQGDYSSFSQSFKQQESTSAKLFGFIPLGSASQSSQSSTLVQGSSNSTFTVTLAPPTQTVAVGPLDATAYVIGATVVAPGAAA